MMLCVYNVITTPEKLFKEIHLKQSKQGKNKMADVSPNILIIALSVSRLNIQVKRQSLIEQT